MDCPVCKTAMLVVEYQGVELDHCLDCRGTWFDREELGLVLERALPDIFEALPAEVQSLPDAGTREKPRRCPLCRKRMRKVYLGQKNKVLIDICPLGEGMWFDSEEVGRLALDLSEESGPGSMPAIQFLGTLFGPSNPDQQSKRRRK